MSGTLYCLERAIRRNRYSSGGRDAVLGCYFSCPHTPAVGWQVSTNGGNTGGTIVRIWWDNDTQKLRLYAEDERHGSGLSELPEAEYEDRVGELLDQGYVPLNEAARAIARKRAGNDE